MTLGAVPCQETWVKRSPMLSRDPSKFTQSGLPVHTPFAQDPPPPPRSKSTLLLHTHQSQQRWAKKPKTADKQIFRKSLPSASTRFVCDCLILPPFELPGSLRSVTSFFLLLTLAAYTFKSCGFVAHRELFSLVSLAEFFLVGSGFLARIQQELCSSLSFPSSCKDI